MLNRQVFFLLLTCVACSVRAHLPFYEPARLLNGNDTKYTFNNPFDILERTKYNGQFRPEESVALEVLLTKDTPYSVVLYNKTFPDEVTFFAYPLVPACKEYETIQPRLALWSPADTSKDGLSYRFLPFDVPKSHRITTTAALNYSADPSTRQIFHVGMGFNQSWYLPYDYDHQRYLDFANNSNDNGDFSYAIKNHLVQPGEYYLVIWLPPELIENEIDASLVVGRNDDFQKEDYEYLKTLPRGHQLHVECSPPDDSNPVIEG